jgi:molybdenum cofactor cytidylyltransferase
VIAPRGPQGAPTRIAAVILAAGAGTRMGGVAKAMVRRPASKAGPGADRTFLECVVATCREVGLVDGVVVVGPPFGEAVAAHARSLGLRVAVNADPARGMASSVGLGFTALAELGKDSAEAAWLWPVDHPDVRSDTLRSLIAAVADHEVVVPHFEDRGGHPPLIRRVLWPQMAGCATADDGARGVIARSVVRRLAVDDPGVVRDIDRLEDNT